MSTSTFAMAGMDCRHTGQEGTCGMSGIPVTMAKVGDRGTIISVSGRDETKRFLAGLGFTPGAMVKAVCEANGNMILDVKGSKIAVDRRMASKILFCPGR